MKLRINILVKRLVLQAAFTLLIFASVFSSYLDLIGVAARENAITGRFKLWNFPIVGNSNSNSNNRNTYSNNFYNGFDGTTRRKVSNMAQSNTDISINDRYIVYLEEDRLHDDIHLHLNGLVANKLINKHIVHSKLEQVFRGMVIELSSEDVAEGKCPIDVLRSIPGVLKVTKDSIKSLPVTVMSNREVNKVKTEDFDISSTSSRSSKGSNSGGEQEEKEEIDLSSVDLQRRLADDLWGLDRIDQQNLPLNSQYNAYFTGRGVDVYVVDTGIDTTHVEFASSSTREVKNIYDAFAKTKTKPSTNTDGQGHGTHVSGTVGGVNVGVSPEVNLYGVKILSDEGSGSTSDIVTALEFVLNRIKSTGKRSVVTMSLGGACDDADCSRDPLVIASEKLVAEGVLVSVAAGNEGCNACFGSPNAAPHTINVGASDEYDKICYFSNFGQCVDVIAPGWNILSSCSGLICGDNDYYLTMSGTSMATPHVAGVIAQLLQKYPTATPSDIVNHITCDAVKEIVTLESKDSITRNLLLNIPLQASSACNPASGCPSSCSSNGVCLPMFSNTQITNGSSPYTCHCDAGRYGTTCESTSDLACSAANSHKQTIELYDSFADGWTFTNFAILDNNGNIYDNIYDSLCYEDFTSKQYCMPPGTYQLSVSRGPFPNEVGWKFCGVFGGAPFNSKFVIDSNGRCSLSCPNGLLQTITLVDSYGDGWNGAYYSIYDSNGVQLYGGIEFEDSTEHVVCLPSNNKYYILFPYLGSEPDEVHIIINNQVIYTDSAATIEVDSSNKVTITVPKIDSCPNSALNAIGLLKYNLLNKGWQSGRYQITDATSNALIATDSMPTGFLDMDTICIADGCYNFESSLSTSDTQQISDNQYSFWSACGSRGKIPWNSKFCVESRYNLCYGINSCPYAKSYSPHNANQYLFVTHYDPDYKITVLDSIGNIHGVHDFCDLEDGTYAYVAGAGKEDIDNKGNLFFSCAPQSSSGLQLPVSGQLTIKDNTTSCSVQSNHQQCTNTNLRTLLFAKIDLNGDGWGSNKVASYKIMDSIGVVVAHGNLEDGQFGLDKVCLAKETCFTLTVDSKSYPEEVLWVFCGFIGGAGKDYTNMNFCVTPTGCYFTNTDDDHYSKIQDDDFPPAPPSAQSTWPPTHYPTAGPTARTNLPTSNIPDSAMPTASPTASPTDSPAQVSFTVFDTNIDLNVNVAFINFAAASEADSDDLRFVEYAAREVLEQSGLSIWESDILPLEINSLVSDVVNLNADSVDHQYTTKKSRLGNKLEIHRISSKVSNRKLKTSVIRSLEALKMGNDPIFVHDRNNKKNRGLAASSSKLQSSSTIPIVIRIKLSIEWKSVSGISIDNFIKLLTTIYDDSMKSGQFQANLDYSLRYFKDLKGADNCPVRDSSILTYDIIHETVSSRVVSPVDSPASDDIFENIIWPDNFTSKDDGNSESSSKTLANGSKYNNVIIGVAVGFLSGLLLFCICRYFGANRGYNKLDLSSHHGASHHEVELANKNGRPSLDSLDGGEVDLDLGGSALKSKGKSGNNKGYILAAVDSQTPTPEDIEQGNEVRKNGSSAAKIGEDDDDEVVSVIHLNRQFDTVTNVNDN